MKFPIIIIVLDNDWNFRSYKGTNLGYDILCESVNSDQEEKKWEIY